MEDSTFDYENGKICIPFVTKGIPISGFRFFVCVLKVITLGYLFMRLRVTSLKIVCHRTLELVR